MKLAKVESYLIRLQCERCGDPHSDDPFFDPKLNLVVVDLIESTSVN